MERLIIFGILSIPIIIISRRSLFDIKNHGFYRFFSWECILWLAASNYKFWFDNPLDIFQIFSWIFLIIGAYLVIVGVILIKKRGKPSKRNDEKLFQFEQTSELIDTGIFRYIRHPMYSSLLFLSWGIFFKNVNIESLIVSVFSSVFLYLTALYDEKECIKYFGGKYTEYMKRSKRFIPYLF